MYFISIFFMHLFVDLSAKASVLLWLFFVIKMTKLAKLKIVRPRQIEHAFEHFKFNRLLFKNVNTIG